MYYNDTVLQQNNQYVADNPADTTNNWAVGLLTPKPVILASSPKPVVNPGAGATAAAAAEAAALLSKYPDLPNKLQHVFGKMQHGLGAFLNSFGGNQTAAFSAIDKAAQQAVQSGNVINGVVMRFPISVQGTQMQVNGRVIDGVIKVSTAYIPPL
jgi:hypothetical protein